jgi:hypothetical protein
MAGRETSLMSNISPCHLEGEKHVRETSLLSNIWHRNGRGITGKVC